MARIFAVGDIHNNFAVLEYKTRALAKQYGTPDVILAVGDVEPVQTEEELRGVTGPGRFRRIGDFNRVHDGTVTFPAPLFFIGGNHEPWPTLMSLDRPEVAPGMFFLGRSGVREFGDTTVAFLSGIHSPKVSEQKDFNRKTPSQWKFWIPEEVEGIVAEARGRTIDILVTHEWPSGIGGNVGQSVGRDAIRYLNEALQPAVHVSGHHHRALEAQVGDSQFVGLNHITGERGAVRVLERVNGRYQTVDALTPQVRTSGIDL